MGDYAKPLNTPYRSAQKLHRDNALSEITSNATLKATALANLGITGGYATTATAAGTTTLTNQSGYNQFFTGSTTQTVALPVASTLTLGQAFRIVNNSSGLVTVNSSGGNLVALVYPNQTTIVTAIALTGTDATSWSVSGGSAAGSSEKHTQVTLAAADILGLYATPIQLVAAPGAGHSIAVTKAIFAITRTSTAFASGGVGIVQYGSTTHGGGTQALDSTLASTVITGAAGLSVSIRNGAVVSDSSATDNAALYISNQTGSFTTGTGTATLDVWYVIY